MTGRYRQKTHNRRKTTNDILRKVKWNRAALDIKRGFEFRYEEIQVESCEMSG